MDKLIFPIVSIVMSMAVISLMWRFAPILGMIDKPDPRKVHARPIARVGGWGIVLGSLLPVFLWLPLNPLLEAYIYGSIILLFFGALDDVYELGHYPKFIGQFAAVLLIIFYGDLYIQRIPFFDDISTWQGIAITLFSMVGMINAINHSDGLDGLAGGESLLSLIVIALFAYSLDNYVIFAIAAAVMGGIIGFLRFNTHPARVFMGDSGSQFLGFTLAFLVVYLTQDVDTAMSPALPLLFLGLPVIDIVVVLYKRVSQKMNWFKATRNHVHHRLLDLGFEHYETVVIIYAFHAGLLISSLFLRYEWDWLIIMVYLLAAISLFMALTFLEAKNWRAHAPGTSSRLSGFITRVRQSKLLKTIPVLIIGTVIPAYVILGSIFIAEVPGDFGVVSAFLFLFMLVALLFGRQHSSMILRGVIYTVSVFVAYLSVYFPPTASATYNSLDTLLFAILFISLALVFRFSKNDSFQSTPMDYLIILIVLTIGILAENHLHNHAMTLLFLKGCVILYGCEVMITKMKCKWNILNVSILTALSILGLRGLIF